VPLPAAQITDAGDSAVRLEVAAGISDDAHERVRAWLAALDAARPVFVVDVVPAYRSLLVLYDAAAATSSDVRAWIASAAAAPAVVPAPRTVEIPVWYDPAVAPDLLDLAREKALPVEELVRRHAAPVYRVHMLGFRPGFPYLGGLDPGLAAPRLATPRVEVAAGSVGIGGTQTGIYPVRSPGGWRLIGRTPLRLFDATLPSPFLLGVGDRVRFVPIGGARYRELGGA
jgi:inhibitor of KinA